MKHIKTICCVLLAALLLCGTCTCGLLCFAEDAKETQIGTLTIPATPASTRAARFADDAQLLTADETSALLKLLDETSERLQFDIVIITAEHTGSRSRSEFARDYYDNNGYGYGKEKDGTLLLLSMAEPGWSGYSSGTPSILFNTDFFIQTLEKDAFTTALNAGKYYDAFTRYVKILEDFETAAKSGNPYDIDNPYPGTPVDPATPTDPTAPALTYGEPIWQWEDETVARATFVSTDGSDKVSVSALASEGAIKSASAENGATVYTATVTFDGKTYTNTYTVYAPVFKAPVWEWENETLARATFVSADGKATISSTARAQDDMIKSSKQPNGDVVYTATVIFDGKTYTDTYTVPGPAYGKPTWKWTGTQSATASFVSKDGSVTKRVTATVKNGGIKAETKGTCGTNGKTVYTATVTFGGKTYANKQSVALAHKWKTALKPATTKEAGQKTFTCTVCGKVVNNPIAKIAKIGLSKTKLSYNGKKQTPTVTIKDANGKTLKKNKTYTVSYAKGRKDVGVYTVTVTFKGNYSGSKTLKFRILPAAPKNVTAAPGNGNATLKWDAVPGAQQYKVYCMREGGKSFFQVATTYTPSAVIGSLKNGVTYLFKVKAVTTVDGKETASAACKAVRVTPAVAAQSAAATAA